MTFYSSKSGAACNLVLTMLIIEEPLARHRKCRVVLDHGASPPLPRARSARCPPPLPHPPHPSQPTGRAAAADPTLRKPSLSSSTPSPYPPWHALSALTPAGPSSIKSHRDPRTVCFRIASSVLFCSLPPSESTSTSQQPCYLRPAGGTSTCSTTPFHFLIYSF